MKNVGTALLITGMLIALTGFVAMSGLEDGSFRASNFFAEIMYVGQFVGGALALFGLVLTMVAPTPQPPVE